VRWAGELLRDAAALGILLLTVLAVFVPAALLSAITPMVVKLQLGDVRRTGRIVGQLSSIGTIGGITATLGTGFVLVAALPSSAILLGLAGTLAAAGVALYLAGERRGASLRWTALTDRVHRRGAAVAVVGLLGAGLSTVAPNPCDVETAYHCAAVVTDPNRPTGRLLLLNSARHSYVDLADPRHLEFPYTQWFAAVIDEVWPAPQPIRALHLGGGGFTMPRYLAATRPGSSSRVIEIDPALVALDERKLGVAAGPDLDIEIGDARIGVRRAPDVVYDVVIGDAFGNLAVPWHLTTAEFVSDVRRVLRPDGVYLLNVIDYPPARFMPAEVATIRSVFPEVALITHPDALAGTIGANYVVVASATKLPLERLRARLATLATPTVLVSGPELSTVVGGARILTDDFAPVDQLITHA
jgi:spermidine synthase